MLTTNMIFVHLFFWFKNDEFVGSSDLDEQLLVIIHVFLPFFPLYKRKPLRIGETSVSYLSDLSLKRVKTCAEVNKRWRFPLK